MPDEALIPCEDSLYERHRILVDKGQDVLRIDKFLQNRLEGATRSKIQKAITQELVKVNGQSIKNNYKVKPLDDIIIWDEKRPPDDEIIPENIPLSIVYEDRHLLVVYKAAGMVVHPGCGNYRGTLLNAVAYHFQKQYDAEQLLEMPRLGLVHRIDKNTSGLLVLGKDNASIQGLIRQFAAHSIERRYTALAWGDIAADYGRIEAHIGRHLRYRKLFAAYPDGTHGKHAVTHYEVKERLRYVTLIECVLETGRTHQIRVHLQQIGHPLFGDTEYGGDRIVKGTIYKKYQEFVRHCLQQLPRQALHAQRLGFLHPVTGEKLCFHQPLPEDMREVLEKWRRYTQTF